MKIVTNVLLSMLGALGACMFFAGCYLTIREPKSMQPLLPMLFGASCFVFSLRTRID